jgi:hypothetical protein
MPSPMNDLVVVVPGILGSELRKDNHLLWGFPEGLRGLLTARPWLRNSAAQLVLQGDDPTKPYLDDGIRPTALVSVPQVVADFFKTDGYDLLRSRLFENFQLESVGPDTVGNYLEFPYDWRRDNTAAAHRLGATVEEHLARLTADTGNPEAKVIYICHSMGGLVTRYYLEVLGGWKTCKALITLGTPYRGSLAALDFLVRGYSKAGVDLTDFLRSCTSVYQLLPIYKVVDVDGVFYRVADCADLPHVDQARAQAARQFHERIRQAVGARPQDAYPIFYFSGVSQPTLQSATWNSSQFEANRFVPDDFASYRETGDNTVPYVSSIPHERSRNPLGAFTVPTGHAMLQSNDQVWSQVQNILNRLQDETIDRVLFPRGESGAGAPPAICLDLKDLYSADPVVLRARLLNAPQGQQLVAELRRAGSDDVRGPIYLQQEGDWWVLNQTGLPDGLYRVRVETYYQGQGAPPPVEDIFEVARPEAV